MTCRPQAMIISSFVGKEKLSKAGGVSEAETGAGEYNQKMYFEMSGALFDTLPNMLEVHIKKNWTNYCKPLDLRH